MTKGHLALIVEDDEATAEDLGEILRSLDCVCEVVTNKQDALAALSARAFCLILLDLEIKSGPGSNKGHATHGQSLLREIRQTHSAHTGQSFWLPIIVVSGFAREVPVAVELMREGASDLIQKPTDGRLASQAIRRVLENSGRSSHRECGSPPMSRPPVQGTAIALTISGDRDRRRTRIALQGRAVSLPDSSLKVLLRLVVSHMQGSLVHKRDLGATEEQGFKGISRLNEAFRPVLGELNVFQNDYNGNYGLTKDVVVGSCDTDKLIAIGDNEIAALARKLRALLDSAGKKSDGNS